MIFWRRRRTVMNAMRMHTYLWHSVQHCNIVLPVFRHRGNGRFGNWWDSCTLQERWRRTENRILAGIWITIFPWMTISFVEINNNRGAVVRCRSLPCWRNLTGASSERECSNEFLWFLLIGSISSNSLVFLSAVHSFACLHNKTTIVIRFDFYKWVFFALQSPLLLVPHSVDLLWCCDFRKSHA